QACRRYLISRQVNRVRDYDVFARFYDLDTEGHEEDLDFWLSLARRTGGPILELACGTGRVMLPLAEQGFSVVGVDISPEMLAIARAKLGAAAVLDRTEIIQGDVLTLNLKRQFPLVFVALNSFGHFNEPGEPERALERIHAHLKPGGILALDLPNPVPGAFGDTSGLLIHDYTREGPEPGWRTVKLRSQVLAPVDQEVDVSLLYDEVGPTGEVRRTLASFVLRYFYRNELRLLVERAGLAVEEFYGGYDLQPLTEDSDRLILLARRS
ncbi:MAG TPA: class I SAM-dependent methyltransferase, partial [Chloroflexota bacterium]|nr:class I SAM-dependent methyltransferase [Chloroflexota bacterium]